MSLARKNLKRIYLKARKRLLHGLGKILRHRRIDSHGQNPRRVLVIRIDRIGDMVLSIPFIDNIKRHFKTAEVHVLCSPSNVGVLVNKKEVGRLFIVDRKWGLLRKLKFLGQLKRQAYDIVLDPYFGYDLSTAIVARAVRGGVALGFDSYGKGVFYDRSVTADTRQKHFTEITAQLLTPLGIPEFVTDAEIVLAAFEIERASKWINDNVSSSKAIIGLHPGAYYQTQQWPITYYGELASLIIHSDRYEVIVFGSPQDTQRLNAVKKIAGERLRVFIGQDMREFLSVLSHCNLLICNNSGPLHAATALHVPTVSFMGPTLPDRWWPKGRTNTVLRRVELECLGCNSGHCLIGTHACMREITPEHVYDCIQERLGNTLV